MRQLTLLSEKLQTLKRFFEAKIPGSTLFICFELAQKARVLGGVNQLTPPFPVFLGHNLYIALS